MPLLDVSSVLTDADFADRFSVRRRMESIGADGRNVFIETDYDGVLGVVTAISPNDLQRHSDYADMSRSISVVTRFFLRGETPGEQPDIVKWRNNNYIVRHVDLYPQFGRGFVQAECTSQDRVDSVVGSPPISAFNSQNNSNNLIWLE